MAGREYNAWKSYMINITFNVSCLADSFPHPSHKKGTTNISQVPNLTLCLPSQTPTPSPTPTPTHGEKKGK